MRLRYRPFQAFAIAMLAALVTACAAFAPLYDRAMQQALTDLAVDHTDQAIVGLQLRAIASDPRTTFGAHVRTRPPEPQAVLAEVPTAMRASYLAPVLGYAAVATVPKGEIPASDPSAPTGSTGEVIWREGACDHVTFTAGGCPTQAGDVAISEADARIFGLHVGMSFRVPGIPHNNSQATAPTAGLTISGVYRQRPGDYWFGLSLTGRAGIVDPVSTQMQHDVWLSTRATFTDPSVPPLNGQASTVDLPLDRAAAGVDDVLTLATGIDRLAGDLRHGTGVFVDVHSGLPSIAQDLRDQTGQSRVTVPLLMAQLGLLSVVVLWLVLLAVTEDRRTEVALARLRGRGRRGARALLLGELLPVALAGVVPGAALAVLGAWVARAAVLPGHAPFEVGLPFVAALGLAIVVLTLVTWLAVSRVAREPVERLLRRVAPRRTGWSLGVADALAIAGCGAVVVVFATGGLDGPAALAAPGLLAIVVGLVLAHLTTPTASIVGRRLLARGRVRASVSVLDAARSPPPAASSRSSPWPRPSPSSPRTRSWSATATVPRRLTRRPGPGWSPGSAATTSRRSAPRSDEVDPEGRRVTPVVRVLPRFGWRRHARRRARRLPPRRALPRLPHRRRFVVGPAPGAGRQADQGGRHPPLARRGAVHAGLSPRRREVEPGHDRARPRGRGRRDPAHDLRPARWPDRPREIRRAGLLRGRLLRLRSLGQHPPRRHDRRPRDAAPPGRHPGRTTRQPSARPAGGRRTTTRRSAPSHRSPRAPASSRSRCTAAGRTSSRWRRTGCRASSRHSPPARSLPTATATASRPSGWTARSRQPSASDSCPGCPDPGPAPPWSTSTPSSAVARSPRMRRSSSGSPTTTRRSWTGSRAALAERDVIALRHHDARPTPAAPTTSRRPPGASSSPSWSGSPRC